VIYVREAREILREARSTFDRIGAGGFSYQAARELRAAGENDISGARVGLTRLTPQERQVAQLAGQGLSNRQIGEQLFMSHRRLALISSVS
jgi:DNA-binding NarL/FixJ family response regulator